MDCSQLQKWLRANHAPEFFKVFLSYFQILGSFTMFKVQWPPMLTGMIVWCNEAFKFDILALPNLSCLWAGVSFEAYLRTYTIMPLLFCGCFYLPVVVAYLMGLKNSSPLRWSKTIDRFWTNTVFVMFCIYPAVSITSMLALNCDYQIGEIASNCVIANKEVWC